ncbi:MAG: hypothetical protein E6300_07585 [Clostridium sp.]|uniref:hypothetical protein n=1 Tax=Clostridium sp. TaxID=1506 RepID=UPI001ECE898C|nr:hypothetical protein [Clostridium sp.]MBS5886304.1 hypothetical protein [Clostridium sp.]MDU7148335.1 hypothetical protein [Clostridium sp.]MDU7243276.1 hypothetical protein [Clostridium sp.]
MLNITENITISGTVTIENKQIINMVGSIGGDYPNLTVSILDKEGFKANFITCKEGVNEFIEKVLNKEYEALGGTINE